MKTEYSGHNLLFSYMSKSDLFYVCNMLEKDSVCRWLFFGPNSHEATKKYFEPIIASIKSDLLEKRLPKTPVFTIKDKRSGFFVGQCALLPVEFCEGSYIIGYQLDNICWRRGFGTEACRFLIYYAFYIAGGYRLNGDCITENPGSYKIMEKCGFTRECVQKKYWNHNGAFYDRVLYYLLRDEMDNEYISELKAEFE